MYMCVCVCVFVRIYVCIHIYINIDGVESKINNPDTKNNLKFKSRLFQVFATLL